MRRVLTGEVGAGSHGRIALLAAAMVADAKSQVLMLGTDAAEVEERFLHTEPLLRDGGLVARLVSSPPTKSQLDAIKRGEVHVIFGTIRPARAPGRVSAAGAGGRGGAGCSGAEPRCSTPTSLHRARTCWSRARSRSVRGC